MSEQTNKDVKMLDHRLEKDTALIGELSISQVRLMRDELTWFVLVPNIPNAVELTDLDFELQTGILEEINFITELLCEFVKYDKINIATIGNVVSQLHIHIIARHKNDRAWPNTIWGTESIDDFKNEQIELWKSRIAKKV